MIYLSAWEYDSVIQGTFPLTIDINSVRNGYIYNISNADGDGVSYKAYMAAGTYTCKILGHPQDQRGILKVKINGVTVVTWDMNNGGTIVWNTIDTTPGIVIGSPGVKTIEVIVDGTTSEDHWIIFSEIVFYRTA